MLSPPGVPRGRQHHAATPPWASRAAQTISTISTSSGPHLQPPARTGQCQGTLGAWGLSEASRDAVSCQSATFLPGRCGPILLPPRCHKVKRPGHRLRRSGLWPATSW